MVKAYSMPEKYINYIKDKAKKSGLTESDILRRIIDKYMEQYEIDKPEYKGIIKALEKR